MTEATQREMDDHCRCNRCKLMQPPRHSGPDPNPVTFTTLESSERSEHGLQEPSPMKHGLQEPSSKHGLQNHPREAWTTGTVPVKHGLQEPTVTLNRPPPPSQTSSTSLPFAAPSSVKTFPPKRSPSSQKQSMITSNSTTRTCLAVLSSPPRHLSPSTLRRWVSLYKKEVRSDSLIPQWKAENRAHGLRRTSIGWWGYCTDAKPSVSSALTLWHTKLRMEGRKPQV